MLTKIAWRNVWRSPGRTVTIILAIMVGVAALAFLTGFINGFIESYVRNGIRNEYSHIQMHRPEYKRDREIGFFIEAAEQITEDLQKDERVQAVSGRSIVSGMITSAQSVLGANIYGIDPVAESETTRLDSAIVEGTYFEEINRNPILISAEIAEKLNLKVRSKLVLTFQNRDGDIVAGSFRVDGIFESTSVKINNGVVFVKKDDLNRLLGLDGGVHEIAILLRDLEYVEPAYDSIRTAYPDLEVEDWRELAPQLELMQSQVWINMVIVLVIILGALCLGIVNTMLMAVLERVKEIGMLMAVGMKKTRVFYMIVIETLLMSAVGAPLGILVGLGINRYFQVNGLDLTAYSEGLKELGYDTILYPSVTVPYYLVIAGGIALTAVVASIYPALKATRLRPVEALHKI